jgi:hypothetical protein
VLAGLASGPLLADDLKGVNRFLCTAVQASVCFEDDCESGPAWDWNVPQFIQIDLDKKTLSTTPASGENRSTPIRNMERHDGLIVLQGFEKGKAFSFVIAEETGSVTVAVARDGVGVTVFGACTPTRP